MSFHDIACAETGRRNGIEHQVIQPPDDKPVIDHLGEDLRWCLHREGDGNWRCSRRCGISTPKPSEDFVKGKCSGTVMTSNRIGYFFLAILFYLLSWYYGSARLCNALRIESSADRSHRAQT